jgi:type IV pilus assembly protein PilX
MKPIALQRSGRRGQGGVVLFVALIVLIVMTLSGLALLRQMGVGTSIAGNIAFKENATFVADRGAEVAMLYIRPAPPVVRDTTADSPANGYWSSWVDGFDPKAYLWGVRSMALADDPIIRDIAQTGNTADVFIQRLCANAGMSALDPLQRCSDLPIDNPFRSHGGGLPYGGGINTVTPFPFYRVTTRVIGPRNTVSYTQVLMQ